MNFNKKIPIYLLVIIGAICVFMIVVLAGRITWFSEQPPMEFIPNMDHQFKAIPQSGNTFFADHKSLREPVEGTVARGVDVYALGQGDIDSAEKHNVDPNLEQSEFLLARGQNRFNVFCAACHNFDAKSQSKVVQISGWAGIPDLTRIETQALTNARLFHVISAGQNLMPSYADKISPVDRWAIVYYLRSLQQQGQ